MESSKKLSSPETKTQTQLMMLRSSLSDFPDLDSVFCPSKIGGMSFNLLWKSHKAIHHFMNILREQYSEEWWYPSTNIQENIQKFLERIHQDLRKQEDILGGVHPDQIQGYDTQSFIPYMFTDTVPEERVSRDTQRKWFRYKKAYETIQSWISYLNNRMETSECRIVYEQAQERYFIGISFKTSTGHKKGIQLYSLAKSSSTSSPEFTNLNIVEIERGVGKKVSFRAIDDKLTISGKDGILKDHLLELTRARNELEKVIFGEWNQWIGKLRDDFTEIIREVSQIVSNVDCLQSSAFLCVKEGYRWPIFKESTHSGSGSGIYVKQLRHPLIEAIHQDFPYVPHTISFGNLSSLSSKVEENTSIGRLVFGVNSSGKSSLMKAIGIAVIMAQAGLPVACEEMILTPFRSIFTRILGNDNLFRGYSTFKVESEELISILQEANEWSLVLGDELCSGTEQYGAEAIVCASVLSLLRRRTPFLFATHWHRLRDIPQLVSRKDLGWNHLYVKMDEEGVIRFDRMLMEGAGPRGYAIDFMRQMNAPENVMSEAEEIRKMLTSEDFTKHSIEKWSVSPVLATTKTSWNSEAKIHAICQICKVKPAEETDHIRERQETIDAGDTFLKDGTSVHHGGNLVGLCRECHEEKTAGRIHIKGWREVLEKGVQRRELEFERVKEQEMNERMREQKEERKEDILEEKTEDVLEEKKEENAIEECILRMSSMGASLRHIQAHLRTTLGLKYKQTQIESIIRGYGRSI
jgi:5-methylcytosine-specific restriction endonuclease McrA